jgi:hypothetical protein
VLERSLAAAVIGTAAALGCGAAGGTEAQEVFWSRLQSLCGQAFEGRAVEAPDTDATFAGAVMVMHVSDCTDDEVRIPLHLGEDRSRTWIITRTAAGLRLKHDHRHPDGTPEENTDYGGDTVLPGSVWRQEFPADAYSVAAVPARESQLWYLEIRPDDAFVYGLRREATGLRYRFEFDLTAPVAPPPPPWAVAPVAENGS